ncbi:ATP-binding cassette domain-containing protein [Roseospira marina]|uniref:ATP-binding cassette domain-containing protein n=1 Tax=Roseospira marina TaxID=140057 RepID=A0A5M6IFJ8_9PROT|nr:oligopeptide/dipeptide ABC transporter ATP-binding protein [Roseospira marina]KAA5606505.1 ATP-binding cassette domain-containing protein [Roseospira marina]MBB4314072.1 peptide/nickel transport system ATP-binding protein [Roseospira marina]MBB5087233.1 peptide/nickel transport system ATP-binding protein [Roseospira marina]
MSGHTQTAAAPAASGTTAPAAVADRPLVEVDGLIKHFDLGGHFLQRERPTVKAINDVSLGIRRGEAFCLVGESGCGKSTLARIVMGLLDPTGGAIRFDGTRIDGLKHTARKPFHRRMQMIFQNPYASLNPRRTVQKTLEEPLRFHFPNLSDADVKTKVEQVMVSVGNDPSWGTRYPHEFSGGQRQRISIARALMVDPDFVVADEPISALDVSIQAQVLNVMMDTQEARDLTYLFITHDLSVVRHFGTRVGVMYLGTLCELADTATLFENPRHPYTRILLSAIPRISTEEMKPPGLPGEVPSAMNLPSGCVFHDRCPLANARCSAEVPRAQCQADGTLVACHAVEEGRG